MTASPAVPPLPSTGSTVVIPAPDGGVHPAYARLLPNARRGVVVLHEIFGRMPEIDGVADRFAAAGYAAVAPDLFHGRNRVACIQQAMADIATGTGPLVDKVLHTRAWLMAQTGLPQARIGVIGFCLGGGFALAVGRGWGAVSTNYGDVPPAAVLQGIGPVVGCYGGRDRIFGTAGELLKQRVPAGTSVAVHTFPTVGHSFLTHGDHPIAKALTWPFFHVTYNPAVAEEAWGKILAFFDQHLA